MPWFPTRSRSRCSCNARQNRIELRRNAGLVKITIVEDYLANFWKQIFTSLTPHPDVKVRTGGEVAWMIRKDSPKLKEVLHAFLMRFEKSGQRTDILARYLKNTKWAKGATSAEDLKRFENTVALFRKYGERYELARGRRRRSKKVSKAALHRVTFYDRGPGGTMARFRQARPCPGLAFATSRSVSVAAGRRSQPRHRAPRPAPPSFPTAAAMPAKRRVWSQPLRLTRRTRAPSL